MTLSDGAIGQTFVSGEPTVITDYPHWDGAIPELVKRGVKRVAAVPLKVNSRNVGVLAVRFLGPRGCEPAHVRALQLLAAPMAAILDAALARQRAEAGEARLAAIVDHLPCGVLVRSNDGAIVLLNETGRRMGRIRGDSHPRPLERLDELEVVDAHTGRRLSSDELPTVCASRGEPVIDREVRVRLSENDDPAWMRISAVPLHGSKDEIVGAVAIFSDISRERQLVHSLHTSARENTRLVLELQEAHRRHEELLAGLRPAALEHPPSDGFSPGLSVREREVLALLARGETNRQIGAAIGLSPGTVKKHVEHILRKLGVGDRTQAAVRAAELGLAIRTDPVR
jgi:DNA-binding CsgD family transcriptional regulator/PAS domain-containing protein